MSCRTHTEGYPHPSDISLRSSSHIFYTRIRSYWLDVSGIDSGQSDQVRFTVIETDALWDVNGALWDRSQRVAGDSGS